MFCFLAVVLSTACFHFLILSFYPGLFCHCHVFPAIFVDFSIIFHHVTSPLFFCLWSQQSRSSSVTQRFFFWRCLRRIFFAVSVHLVEQSDYGVQFSIFVYHHRRGCTSTTSCCLESINQRDVIQRLKIKPYLLAWVVFLNLLRCF